MSDHIARQSKSFHWFGNDEFLLPAERIRLPWLNWYVHRGHENSTEFGPFDNRVIGEAFGLYKHLSLFKGNYRKWLNPNIISKPGCLQSSVITLTHIFQNTVIAEMYLFTYLSPLLLIPFTLVQADLNSTIAGLEAQINPCTEAWCFLSHFCRHLLTGSFKHILFQETTANNLTLKESFRKLEKRQQLG